MSPPEWCHPYRERIGAFLLGKLDGEEFEAVRAHLNGCPACWAEARELQPVVAALADADPDRIEEDVSPPRDLEESTLAPVLEEIHFARHRGRGLWWSAAAAICVLAIGLAGFAWHLEPGVASEQLSFSDEARGVDVNGEMIARDGSTKIRLDVSGLHYCQTYTVTLVSKAGKRVDAGTFFGAGHETVRRTFKSTLSRENADRLEVRAPGGERVSLAKLPEEPQVADRGLPSLGGILPWADTSPPNEEPEECNHKSKEPPGKDTSPEDPREQPRDHGSGGVTPPSDGRKPEAMPERSGPGDGQTPSGPSSPGPSSPRPSSPRPFSPGPNPCKGPPEDQPAACHQYDR